VLVSHQVVGSVLDDCSSEDAIASSGNGSSTPVDVDDLGVLLIDNGVAVAECIACSIS
jgi:hypothetical protein